MRPAPGTSNGAASTRPRAWSTRCAVSSVLSTQTYVFHFARVELPPGIELIAATYGTRALWPTRNRAVDRSRCVRSEGAPARGRGHVQSDGTRVSGGPGGRGSP